MELTGEFPVAVRCQPGRTGNTGKVIYDTKPGEDRCSEAATDLAGGSIVIHAC